MRCARSSACRYTYTSRSGGDENAIVRSYHLCIKMSYICMSEDICMYACLNIRFAHIHAPGNDMSAHTYKFETQDTGEHVHACTHLHVHIHARHTTPGEQPARSGLCVCIYTRTHTNIHTERCTHTHTYTHSRTLTRTRTRTHTRTHMHAHAATCRIWPGTQTSSAKTTALAAVRVRPTPAAVIDKTATCIRGSF